VLAVGGVSCIMVAVSPFFAGLLQLSWITVGRLVDIMLASKIVA